MSSKVEACPECTQRCLRFHRKTGNSSSVTSFFKVMFGDRFSEVVFFPPIFASTVSKLVNKKVVLEDSLGQQWKVTVSNCEGSLAFQEGWSAFSSEHSLEIGDFVIFNHIMDLHFNVSIYTKTGCEKVWFAEKSYTRKRIRSTCPVLEITNEGLSNPQASSPSVGSGSNVTLSQDKFHVAGYRNMNVYQGKRRKYQSNDEWHGPLNIVDDSYCLIDRNKDVGPEENRSPLFNLFSMEMQMVNSCINENSTNKAAQDEINPNCASSSQNTIISVGPVNSVPVDIRGDTEVLPSNVSANKINDKRQCFEEADIKMSVSGKDPCHDRTIEVPFISSATNSDQKGEPFCDMPLKIIRDYQNVPAMCNTVSTITRHDQGSSVKQEYPPNSLKVKKCLHGDEKKIIKMEPLEIKTEVNNCGDITEQILEPKVIKEEFLETSNQSGRENNDTTDNADPIGTPAHISCVVAKDTLSFLELPMTFHLPCSRGRRNPENKKVVFLRDPSKRLWPILYHEMPNVQVLTSGWEAFCCANRIESGDECLFHVKDELKREYNISIRKCKN
ncbi:B3 domain-containing protein Os01g0905400-like isoform X1 [Cucurbita maxima]|uniref:B3 domain-containing protein Os01g0905400-like isoform X1 n=1 Tax=Cucurbita maxima TaxID=3661 RepID=A0A6J1KGU5_CUCMA|nr:B3 domain-containing protein Os01g0905400-like isoform X1 [Cucurbita maxima]XP_023000797.1 B3 domain-containing protein Os01g0905400-like isoform X1 [Cucurbita maxima]XP_023000798.1 B3 domain-containing protein Os01g0905400-like isoform X1 [Cucurbita maxima]XP_023000799.1 B3 domain-containing protein Os01g0905400-like isoform X1 [Cucurbita maxima]